MWLATASRSIQLWYCARPLSRRRHPVRRSYSVAVAFPAAPYLASAIGRHPAGSVPDTTTNLAPSSTSLCAQKKSSTTWEQLE